VVIDPFSNGGIVSRLPDALHAPVREGVLLSNRSALVRLLTNQASRAHNAGDLARALVLARRMSLLAPDFTSVWWERAQLEVRQDPDGYQHGVVTAEAGKRAFFRQKRDTQPGAPDEYVEGEGELIEYDGRTDIVKLIRRAELRRYREATLADELTGALIVYNNITDVFTVDGQKATPGGASAGAGGGRVRAVLAPKEPAPGTAAAPPRSESPTLRPTPGLGGGK